MESSNLAALLALAGKQVGAIAKTETNEHFKYKFRGIDTLTNAMSGVLHDLGIIIVPEVTDVRASMVETARRPTQEILVFVTYRFYGAGETLEARVVGQAMDSGDRGMAKALTDARKRVLADVLMPPFKDDTDPERDSHERTPLRSQTEVRSLISAATTVEELRALWPDVKRLGLADELNARRSDIDA